ncbi:cation-binding protein [Frankia sp. CcI49]|uniref:Hemerythrin HHE cation binding domain-containing protein n=1 Tax=Parafrankia irregularis TaxID=795642 RepID=A0A0S4QVP2_9ACTN|nr:MULTISPECIES: hemerythrin domain-containing protein [Frankiaceae]KPM52516.1 cation-binding protein [Frankia sp. R43]MBE3205781.1 hemerythrin domain-containing protein [Parafrankia sp. CH37]ONH59764.1 cation-binding protein [Frankia sp. CcI49]CUU59655.1 Hemerythrin HHE cation binding domain-containing protein [Parafrankia irregularis]
MADIVDLIYADHDWLRRHFLYLDYATSNAELKAVWEVLATRLDTHAEAEETVFYPALLKKGEAGEPEDETEDAIEDHNKIRAAVADARSHGVGSRAWFEAVGRARTENGEHLDEEEREAFPDFIKSTGPELRHELAMRWLRFYAEHQAGAGVNTESRDAARYIEVNS